MQNGCFRRLARPAIALSVGLMATAPAWGQLDVNDTPSRVWDLARAASDDPFAPLADVPADVGDRRLLSLVESRAELAASEASREEMRAEMIGETRTELDELLAEEPTPTKLSEALRAVITLHTLATDKDAVLAEPLILDLIAKAEKAAGTAEREQDWLGANELFYRLHLLFEDDGRYKTDVQRLTKRLAMIRLYTPERFWEMRNERLVEQGKDPLPEFNDLGEDFRDKLDGISARSVVQATLRAAQAHVSRAPVLDKTDPVTMREMLAGATRALRTMVTTSDLAEAFPTLEDRSRVDRFVRTLDSLLAGLATPDARTDQDLLQEVLGGILDANRESVGIPTDAILHEFGTGAMGELDDYSAIIWPDEMRRFERLTEGRFQGVGIQIQYDDETQMIKVVTPLPGTPAQIAGIVPGDFIKKIEGNMAVGIGLGQAVDLITGPAGTKVDLTIEREGEELEFTLKRANIALPSVKGWERTGAGDMDWDWFIDRDSGIGYIRLSGFQEDSTEDMLEAIEQMRDQGLEALVFDLRFNPGGLLTQAVSIANLFIDRGTIVATRGTTPQQPERARRGRAVLADIPVAVLINEGSASASEIVSGAIRHYADQGKLDAVVVGTRSFGKGSVQNVWRLDASSRVKLTTHYYTMPDGTLIHKFEGAGRWGVDPHVSVEMLPEQVADSLEIRRDADVFAIDADGNLVDTDEPKVDPDKLLEPGADIQLQAALLLLEVKLASDKAPTPERTEVRNQR